MKAKQNTEASLAVRCDDGLGQKVYLLIEHGDGNDPARIHICKTELERREKTGLAIFGEQVNADLHPTQLEADLQTLADDKRLEFEGDPPLEWVDGYLA